MKKLKAKFLIITVFISCNVISQNSVQLNSGVYDDCLNIAYDRWNNTIKGFFSEESGYDETTHRAKFSCEFYFYSIKSEGNEFKIKSFYPGSGDTISGKIIVLDYNSLQLKLDEEHGGCWNVNHFADSLTTYQLTKKRDWIDIQYSVSEKANFFNDPMKAEKRKSFISKNDVVFIDEILSGHFGKWVFCTYYGKTKSTKGWMKQEDLSDFDRKDIPADIHLR